MSSKRAFFGAVVAIAFAIAAVAIPAGAQPAPPKPPPTRVNPPAPGAVKDAGAPVVAEAGAPVSPAAMDAGLSGVAPGATADSTGDAGAGTSTAAAETPAAQLRKMFPPPPPPTPAQVAALGMLKEEVDAYEKGARDYRDAVTQIIRFHYEAKKKEVLSGLDSEIAIEKAELKKARETAIKRLEEFIATYSGPRAQPEATPDAMYRLAALYEERARSDEATDPIEQGLRPAIALYKRVIVEYPKYRELAGIYYFLGHALNDSGRVPEAMQVWRSSVCHNHYEYPTPQDPKDPLKDTIKPMPQDHDEAYWTAWRNKYRDPKQVSKKNPDTVYTEVYPDDCQGIPQPGLQLGQDPKYVAEIWWQIGNWEFDQLDFPSGVTKDDPGSVWGYNRAASAYTHAMSFKKPPLFGVSLYKYAWTLFKQQRYQEATKEFVELLVYTDDQEKKTGDKGADFRSEAYTYIAGSLTNVEFKGPEPWEPFISRPDILDTEPNPDKAEKKLHIAIDRVKDPKVIPQDKPWTIEIYRALALEFRSLNQFHNAVEIYDTMLAKWPMDPSAPDTQNAIAETYDQLNMTQRPGTPEHDAIAQKALEARTKLANYIGATPWTDANKDNPAALQNAERLVRGGLRQAAAQHTNNGKAAIQQASETSDTGRQLELLSRAATEYKLAATGWYGYLKQDENAPDAYESRYWLADARRQAVRIQVVLHKQAPKYFNEPSKKDIVEAIAAAQDVRDSNEDDKFLDNAAFFVVDVSDVDRDLAYQRFDDSKGTEGVERRQEVKFDGPDVATRNVVKDPIPAVVLQSMNARDEYVRVVPPTLDTQHHSVEYQYYVGETYFLYGQFDEAAKRFEPMWKDHCKTDEYGYRAWEKLITMSNLTRNVERSRQLAEAQQKPETQCGVSEEQVKKGRDIADPTIMEGYYVDAYKVFKQAKDSPPGPERDKLFRKAAEMYDAALQAAPSRSEAPEAAINGAYAWKQVGEYNKAIALYNKFITEYGSNDRLTALQKGDPKTKAAPDPKEYGRRVKFLGDAYDALSSTYISFFSYAKAADTYEKVAGNDRFDEPKRREAARQAMILYSNLGQRDKMLAEYRLLNTLHPSAEDKLDGDYRVASYDYHQWDPKGTGQANTQTNAQAQTALMGYFNSHQRDPGAGKFLIEAAYETMKLKKSMGDTGWRDWAKRTVSAWDAYDRGGGMTPDGKGKSSQQPPYVDYAAEADLTLLDEEITAKWDVKDKHTYTGSVADVMGEVKTDASGKPVAGADGRPIMLKKGKYLINAEEADKWDKALDGIIKKYTSVEWVPSAKARQGKVYDTLRNGLYFATKIKTLSAKEEAFLNTLRNSGRQDLMDKADQLEDAKKDFWRSKKAQELDGADGVMVNRYATAIAVARKYNVRNAYINTAISRMAYYTDIINPDAMAKYVATAKDDKGNTVQYTPGMYQQSRPGLAALPPPSGESKPLPAAP